MSNFIDEVRDVSHFLYRVYSLACERARRKAKEQDLTNEEFLELEETKIADKVEYIVDWWQDVSNARKCDACHGVGYKHIHNTDKYIDAEWVGKEEINTSLEKLSVILEDPEPRDFGIVCKKCNGSGRYNYPDEELEERS
jgi:hypothetical protein